MKQKIAVNTAWHKQFKEVMGYASHQQLIKWGYDCVMRLKVHIEEVIDNRILEALEGVDLWLGGHIDVIRAKTLAQYAHVAAKEAPTVILKHYYEAVACLAKAIEKRLIVLDATDQVIIALRLLNPNLTTLEAEERQHQYEHLINLSIRS